jgi:peroxiredoxin
MRFALFLGAIALCVVPAYGQQAGLLLRLLHVREVQSSLELSEESNGKLQQLLRDTDADYWHGLRQPNDPKAPKLADVEAKVSKQLADLFTPAQRTRLQQLQRRAVGTPYMTSEDAIKQLKLTGSQQQSIVQAIKGANEKRQSQKDKPDMAALQAIELEEAKQIHAVLKPEQQQTLVTLVGDDFNMAQITEIGPVAPKVEGIETWFNGEATTLEQLRGKVVVLHFFAGDCINCIRNLPHYNRWASQYDRNELVVLGIQTPELPQERQVDHVREVIDQHDIRYLVAHDEQSTTWSNWHNSMWPTVYLIDRDGHVRTWWEGELNWQGADGDKRIEAVIDTLLSESASQ